MATIERYQTKSGAKRYRVRYRTPDRRQIDKRGFRTKRDAEQFAATVEVAKMRGGVPASDAGPYHRGGTRPGLAEARAGAHEVKRLPVI